MSDEFGEQYDVGWQDGFNECKKFKDERIASLCTKLVEAQKPLSLKTPADKIAACKEMGIDVDKFNIIVDEHNDPFMAVVVTLREYLEALKLQELKP